MQLFLVRHGEVAAADIFYGQLDVPLSARGLQQTETAVEALCAVAPAAVYGSDLQRAATAARALAERTSLPCELSATLREMHLGALEGLRRQEATARFPELAARRYEDMVDYAFPDGGETLRQVAARAMPFIDALRARHGGQRVVVVAHNSVNRLLLGAALGLPIEAVFAFRQDFGCINRIDYQSGNRAHVGLLNWTADAPRVAPRPSFLTPPPR